MAEIRVIIRKAVSAEAATMAAVDARSWPAALAANTEQHFARLLAYPEGQLVAEITGRIVAAASAQRITQTFLLANCESYHRITDGGRFTQSHNRNGEIYQLVGVGVLPEFRGRKSGVWLGRELVDRQVAFARRLRGVQRIVGFTRPAGYHRHKEMAIDEYLSQRRSNGKLLDPVVAFHVDAGAQIVSVHANFRPEDTEACGYGVLIEYPTAASAEPESASLV
jgi:GNAT superfamily N-acetyltransferase